MTLAFVCVCYNAHYIQDREGNFKIPSLLHFFILREVGCKGGVGVKPALSSFLTKKVNASFPFNPLIQNQVHFIFYPSSLIYPNIFLLVCMSQRPST